MEGLHRESRLFIQMVSFNVVRVPVDVLKSQVFKQHSMLHMFELAAARLGNTWGRIQGPHMWKHPGRTFSQAVLLSQPRIPGGKQVPLSGAVSIEHHSSLVFIKQAPS